MSCNFELYDLRISVEAIEGRSVCGMRVGDYCELTESSQLRIPEGKHFCIYALSAVLPLKMTGWSVIRLWLVLTLMNGC
jgi:uncharacterized repeat protein (TIGR04076 family)